MLLSAQYVTKFDQSEAGTNSYLYFHGSPPPEALRPGAELPDLDVIVSDSSGTFVDQRREVTGTGNPVLAFLDLVAPDDIESDFVAHALDRLGQEIDPSMPTHHRYTLRRDEGDVHARYFGARPGGPPSTGLFRALRNSAMALHTAVDETRWRAREPVVIDVRKDADGVRFVMPAPSKIRLASEHFTVPDSVGISDEVWDALEHYHPMENGDLIAIVTGRKPLELLQLGGILLRAEPGGGTLWQWPGRA